MVFQHIEKLKQEYTDKYVVVDDTQPELLRFKNQTGVVRTVNMNGRALVEFDAFENIGWYDIDVDFLKIVDKPLPKEEPTKKAPAKKPAAAPAASDKPAKAGGKMSVAEMLAAARAEKSEDGAQPEKQPATGASTATAKGMSPAEVLAAARAEKGAASVATEEPIAAEAEPVAEPADEPASEPTGATKDLPSDVAGIVAYCRKVDG